MRVLDTLVLRRFLGAYLAFSIMVILSFVVADLFNHVDRFARTGSFLRAVFEHYRTVLPEIWYLFAPFLSLAAAMWVVASLQRANELIPLLAAGVRPARVVAPIVLATAALAGLMWLDREALVPWLAAERAGVSKFELRQYRNPQPVSDAEGGVLMARYYQTKPRRRLLEAKFTRLDAGMRELETAIAATADPVEGGWRLRNGIRASGDTVAAIDSGDGWLLASRIRVIDVECAIEDLNTLTSDQLRSQIERTRGLPSLRVKLEKRLAYPVSSLILLLLGIPFVLRLESGATPLAVLFCMSTCALFFVVTQFCEDLGSRSGGLPPVLAAWLGNGLFGAVGLVACARARF